MTKTAASILTGVVVAAMICCFLTFHLRNRETPRLAVVAIKPDPKHELFWVTVRLENCSNEPITYLRADHQIGDLWDRKNIPRRLPLETEPMQRDLTLRVPRQEQVRSVGGSELRPSVLKSGASLEFRELALPGAGRLQFQIGYYRQRAGRRDFLEPRPSWMAPRIHSALRKIFPLSRPGPSLTLLTTDWIEVPDSVQREANGEDR